MKKKIALLMSVFLLFRITAVLADMPSGSVIFGKKAYSLKYVNDPENLSIIRGLIRELKTDEKIFVKNYRGDWYANNGERIDKKILPQVTYQSDDNKIVTYKAEDGEVINETEFGVRNIAISNKDTVEITFTGEIFKDNIEKFITVGGYIGVEKIYLNSERKTVYIKLEDEISTKRYDLPIRISSDIKNINEEVLGSEYNEEILVLNKASIEDETFNQKVVIIQHGFKGKNIVFEKEVTISAAEVRLEECSIGKISIDPGRGESAELINMNIEEVKIYSGGSNSIRFEKMNIKNVYVNSNENTRVLGSKKSKIKKFIVSSNVILETSDSEIELIKMNDTDNQKTLELRCSADKVIVGNNSRVDSKKNIKNIIIDGNVKLAGNFENIKFTGRKSNLDIESGTSVKNIDIRDNISVRADGNINIENITGTSKGKENIRIAIEEGKEEYIETPSNFIQKQASKDGINIIFKISKSTRKYLDNKYKMIVMLVTFDEGILSTEEILKGVDLQIMHKGKMIDYDILEIKENKARIEFYVPMDSTSEVTIFTEKSNGTEFKLVP